MATTESFDPSLENPVKAAKLFARALGRLYDPKAGADERLSVRFEVAEEIRRGLRRFRRPELPLRDPTWPRDERAIRERIRFASRSKAPEDRSFLGEYGEWRYAIWQVESVAEGNVQALLSCLDTYEAILERIPGEPNVEAARLDVEGWLLSEWRIPGPIPQAYADRKVYVEAHVRSAIRGEPVKLAGPKMNNASWYDADEER